MPYFIAIDAGATKTELVIADEKKQILTKVVGEGCSLTAIEPKQAVVNLEELVKKAISSLPQKINHYQALVMGLAGLDTDKEEQIALERFEPVLFRKSKIDQIKIVNDSQIALRSGTDKIPAIILIAGTGSNCFGFNKNGQTAKSSGLDYLLTDQGSAYDVGLKVLRKAAESFDGRSHKTILEKKLCDYFKVKSILELKSKIYHPTLNKSQIAKLAQLCDSSVKEKDQIAIQILNEAVEDLLKMVKAVASKLNLVEENFDLVLAGGLSKQPYIKEKLFEKLQSHFPKVKIIYPQQTPVAGALQMALELI